MKKAASCSSSSKNDDSRHDNPVIRIKQQKDHGSQPPPKLSLDHLTLDDLLFPLSKQKFLSNYFLTKAVHVSSSSSDHGDNTTKNKRTSNKRRRTTTSSSTDDKNGNASMKTKTNIENDEDDDNNKHKKNPPQNTTSHSRLDDITHGLYDLNVNEIMTHSSSDNIFIWIGSNEDKIQSIEMEDKDSAYLLHSKGHHAAYCRAPPHVEQPLVANLLKETGLGCGQYDPSGRKSNVLARGEVECFFGIRGHLTNWHTDFQENFTIQLTGRKKWKLQQGTVKHPIRGCTPHYNQCSRDIIENQLKASRLVSSEFSFPQQQSCPNDTNSFGFIDEVIMNPGDILYFPAGMWHCVETLEDGLSINVSLMTTNYAQLVCQSLQHYLISKEKWNQPILNNSLTNVKTTLQGLMTDLPNMLQQFVDNQNAQAAIDCILPPILRHAPTFTTTKTDKDSENENENDNDEQQEHSNEDDSHQSEKGEKEEGALLSIMEQEDDEDDSDDDDDETLMINIHTFEPPDDWLQNEWEPQVLLVKQNPHEWIIESNPLALLLSETEVSQQKSSSPYYILNVNYAGNEALESMIRIKMFYDYDEQDKDTNILDLLVNAQKNSEECQTILQTEYVPPIVSMHDIGNSQHENVNGSGKTNQQPKKLNLPPPCLFYFGYLVWKKKQ